MKPWDRIIGTALGCCLFVMSALLGMLLALYVYANLAVMNQ